MVYDLLGNFTEFCTNLHEETRTHNAANEITARTAAVVDPGPAYYYENFDGQAISTAWDQRVGSFTASNGDAATAVDADSETTRPWTDSKAMMPITDLGSLAGVRIYTQLTRISRRAPAPCAQELCSTARATATTRST